MGNYNGRGISFLSEGIIWIVEKKDTTIESG